MVKYLVQVRDDVEAGDEKLKMLEQEMKDWGIWDTDFSLGDVLVEEDESEEGKEKQPKKKLTEFPVLEGEESIVEYVGQYKKACLSKKALLKTVRERLEKDKSTGHERLCYYFSMFIWMKFVFYSELCSPEQSRTSQIKRIRKDMENLENSGRNSAQRVLVEL